MTQKYQFPDLRAPRVIGYRRMTTMPWLVCSTSRPYRIMNSSHPTAVPLPRFRRCLELIPIIPTPTRSMASDALLNDPFAAFWYKKRMSSCHSHSCSRKIDEPFIRNNLIFSPCLRLRKYNIIIKETNIFCYFYL